MDSSLGIQLEQGTKKADLAKAKDMGSYGLLSLSEIPTNELTGHKQLRRGVTVLIEKLTWLNGITIGRNPTVDGVNANQKYLDSRTNKVNSSLPLDLADEAGKDISTLHNIELYIKPNENGGYVLWNFSNTEPKIVWDNTTGMAHEIPPGQSLNLDANGFRAYVGANHEQFLNVTRDNNENGKLGENINISLTKMDTNSKTLTENDLIHWRDSQGNPMKGGI